jgi:transcription-repair coupling factor (superfamily II helicase)
VRSFDRIVDRFAFAPSSDQQSTIDAILADMRSGRPMNRLVCGDVGFGKTEVALRATAAAALAGFQVAVLAPTTVLARQHLAGFRKRLAGTGIRIDALLRGADGAEASVRRALEEGTISVVIGTQAIASDKVRFAKLGLVVIDEEQKFGHSEKRKLIELQTRSATVHALVLTATPIPRTLQASLVGLQDISVISTPPVQRQPTRTFVLPFGQAVVREALLREHRRGGQSFLIAPRIEDLPHLATKLADWVPELSIATAHGKLKPDVLDGLVADFAEGKHDILLATNIIESGLDIPRANAIIITGPQRFGLAQLHQMRGRVGRGARRGTAYVLTDPDTRLKPPTIRRLRTLESNEGLGAGVSLALADMDARGAGDLFGEVQAGHVHAIGTELYQHILHRELAKLAGRPLPIGRADLHVEVCGRIPSGYVPEGNLRLELYRRLARLTGADAAGDFADEMADRFGPIPAEFTSLISIAQLRLWCEANAVIRLDAGPQAVALTMRSSDGLKRLTSRLPKAAAQGNRILLPMSIKDAAQRLQVILSLLTPLRGLA